jgi:hypothetical protein
VELDDGENDDEDEADMDDYREDDDSEGSKHSNVEPQDHNRESSGSDEDHSDVDDDGLPAPNELHRNIAEPTNTPSRNDRKLRSVVVESEDDSDPDEPTVKIASLPHPSTTNDAADESDRPVFRRYSLTSSSPSDILVETPPRK